MEFLKPRAFTLALVVACAGPVLVDRPISAQTGTTFLAIADRTNEHVSIASDGQFVAITWAASKAGGGTDIYVATSRDQGQSFSAPVRANAIDGQANVNGEQPPQVVIARAAGPRTITVIWTAKVGNGTRVLTARSSDEGRTFAAAVPVHGTDGVGNRGWESIAVDPKGKTFALWLDHRDMAAPRREGEDISPAPISTVLRPLSCSSRRSTARRRTALRVVCATAAGRRSSPPRARSTPRGVTSMQTITGHRVRHVSR